jgi:hypothetical protein
MGVRHNQPLKNNAWRINREIADSSGVFTTGDEIKVTLLLNESVTLAKVGSNKIIVANKEFLLTGTNGTTTDTLEFVYTVKINDNISAENFDIDSKEAIVLSDVKDVDGNSIDFSAITDSVALSKASFNTDLIIGGGNKIRHSNGVYEKISGTGWNADVASSKGFVNDGYVIAKIDKIGKRVMLGLSSADANDSFNTIDYALYADSGVGNKFVIYESGQPQHSTGVTYAAGDYMKVVRSGTTITWQ